MKEKNYVTLALLTLVVLFPWLVASMIVNLQQIRIASLEIQWQIQEKYPLPQIGEIWHDSALVLGGVEPVAIAFLVILVSILLWKFRSASVREDFALIPRLIGVALAFLYLYAVVMLLRIVPGSLSSNYGTAHLDISAVLVPIAIGITIISSLLGLYFFFGSRALKVYTDPNIHVVPDGAEKPASFTNQTIYSLKGGMDYRGIIIKCYQTLCKLIESYGVPNSSSFTPREFEAAAVSKLRIGPKYLREATLLFEKARYSDDPVLQEEAERSVESLDRLRAEVDTCVKHPEREWWL